jgi:hydrogenase nickel incorporation protein HypB
MCGTCGCDDVDGPRFTRMDGGESRHPHPHPHPPEGHAHPPESRAHPPEGGDRTVLLEQKVLSRNDDLAAGNRSEFLRRDWFVVNLMSSPGSGKTTLLERTIREFGGPVSVIEGDQETVVDAERIRAAGAPVVQVNTGAGCHLDAAMLRRGMAELGPADGSLVVVENVGNLVCPALFDLGESCRVVVMSVPEGDDKPEKYPHMFRTADLVVINKVDLLPYVSFDLPRCVDQLNRLRPSVTVLPLSATRGDGVAAWLDWLAVRSAPRGSVTPSSIDSRSRSGV